MLEGVGTGVIANVIGVPLLVAVTIAIVESPM